MGAGDAVHRPRQIFTFFAEPELIGLPKMSHLKIAICSQKMPVSLFSTRGASGSDYSQARHALEVTVCGYYWRLMGQCNGGDQFIEVSDGLSSPFQFGR